MPKPRPTQSRIEWLEHLERDGPDSREGWHHVPYWCMQFGWTRWVSGDDPASRDYREELTDAGREVLRQWRSYE